MSNSIQEQYSPVAKFFHWITVLLIIAQCTIGWTMPDVDDLQSPEGSVSLHISVGLLILLVMLARLVWRLISPAPKPLHTRVTLTVIAAKFVHGGLYLLLAISPILGWMNAAERGWNLSFFGLMQLPVIFPANSDLLATIGDWHIASVWALLALIGLHVCAALYHQIILKDGTLTRMLPSSNR
ncbi:cytochrome b [Herbaspirillum chlorophenolicum]|uniref:cytochrome b n=1 Tax=Herbaspirillum chlorophenolicum TaxID=211589 RepID=UPI00067DD156|nr:cytochrome b [Herbaspirillum chlorophenolicum]